MIFWLSVILLIVGSLIIASPSILKNIFKKDKHENIRHFFAYHDETFVFVGGIIDTIAALAVAIMLLVIVSAHTGVDATIEQDREHCKALEFKVDSKSYRDEFGLLNKEVIDEIQAWNEELTYNKHIQRDFWLGIFYPNIYDEFQTIDYERYCK